MKTNKLIISSVMLSLTYTGNVMADAAADENKKPNVLFILADDFGWNDLGCMGSKYYETPNLDRLAQNGVLFTNAYAACQVSSPSRASIMTGKYTPHHGVTDWIGELWGEKWRTMNRHNKVLPAEYAMQLSKDEYTIAECLRDNGYTTFIAGKWHLGEEGSWPEDHGFMVNKGGWSAGNPKGGYFSPYKNPKLEDGPDGENLSMRLGRETVSFMKEQKKNKKPFFAYLSFYAVHGPIETTHDNWKYFRDKADSMGIAKTGFSVDRTLPVRQVQDNPVYAGLIKQMDDAIGYVLDNLEALGLDKNTLVIFTSDNGGVTSGDAYSTSLLPLRGGKGRQWEGGIREPLLIQFPQCKNPGSKCDVPVNGIDFYPTILDYAGIPVPERQEVDGVSIMPLLYGGRIAPRPLFWHYPHYGNQGGEPSSIIRDGDWKLIFYHEDLRCELYNLSIDISESEPLNIQYPDKVKELKAKLDAWLLEMNAKMPEADMLYNPCEEAKVKLKWRTKTLEQKENERKRMLDKNWSPNKDWWGSNITND